MPYITKTELAVLTSGLYIGIGPFIDPPPGSVFASIEVAKFCGELDRTHSPRFYRRRRAGGK